MPHYPVLLLFNIVLFGLLPGGDALRASVVAQEGIVRKTQFPRLVIPLADRAHRLLQSCLNLVVVFIFIVGFGVAPMWTWLL